MISTKTSRIDRAAEHLIESRADAQWDERERAVYTEAATFGLILGMIIWWALAALLAT